MVKGVSIDILGVPELRARLSSKNRKVDVAANDAIHTAGFFVQDEVKQSISGHRAEPKSVDTGRFLNSVETDNHRKMESRVESKVDYAKSLEYGTSRIRARSHFRNSLARSRDKILNFIKTKIKRII